MKKPVLFLLTMASLATIPSQARAVFIDPRLHRYLASSVAPQGPLRLIVLFKDHPKFQSFMNTQPSRAAIEIGLRRNSIASQKSLLQLLKQAAFTEPSIKAKSFWIVNAMVVEVSASQIPLILKDENVQALFSNRRARALPTVLAPLTDEAPGEHFTYGLRKMHIPELRSKLPDLTGRGVRVGVLDSGVDGNHPDLQGRVVAWKDFVHGRRVPYDDDTDGHGTHVSGTIAGGSASGKSIGVAPGAKIVSGKILDEKGEGPWDIILAGMQWIADPDGNPNTDDAPSVASNSWGDDGIDISQDPALHPLCRAVRGWIQLGIFPVFAAGNEGPKPHTMGVPSGCPETFAVGATDRADGIARFSSRGPARWKTGQFLKPTVSAPGVAVVSAAPGGKYQSISGTSMATPHVAGLAALIHQLIPKANPQVVAQIIARGAVDLGPKGPDNTYGYGRVDALLTLQHLSQTLGKSVSKPESLLGNSALH